MFVGVLTFQVLLQDSRSLKQKRGKIKPLLHQLHKKFNISVAEIGLNDKWSQSLIACAMVANERSFIEKSLQEISKFIEDTFLDMQFFDMRIEIW